MKATLPRQLAAELAGTALLLATVVGSGIMAERLAAGNAALALLGNALATGAMLVVLILVFAPISGAHFNPAVSLVFAVRGVLRWPRLGAFVIAQSIGGAAGVMLAHAMFGEALLQTSSTVRSGSGQWLSEAVATFGLLITILGTSRSRPAQVPYAVGLYIAAAYWFTASTSFANPAVTVARSLTDSFAGIRPSGVPAFLLAQIFGAACAALFFRWLFEPAASSACRPGPSPLAAGTLARGED